MLLNTRNVLKMMWLLPLLIIMSIGGTFCDDDDEETCYWGEMKMCQERNRSPIEFPQTPEDFLAACRLAISMKTCILEAKENCDDAPDSSIFHNLPRALDYLKSTCQEDNPTFKVLTNNLPCIERAINKRGFQCSRVLSEKNAEAVETHVQLLIGEDYESDLAKCLFDLMAVACEGITHGYYCGEEVKQAVEELEAHLQRPNSLECTPEHLEELSPLMRVYEGLLLEELELQNAVEEKRK